jgi:hypothetical protein
MKSKLFKSFLSMSLVMLSVAAFSHGNKHGEPENPLFSGLDSKAAKVVTQFKDALKDGDVKVASSLLSKDVLIYESGNAERSSLQYVSGHMLADMKYLANIDSELIEHQVKVYSDVAISISQSKMIRTEAGKTIERVSMETIVVSKVKGQWLITHIHWS